ncbi:MAG: hypothetical protein CO094_13890 [Anaerolineae bacterium CG_4_9_14_3_um_filter_57_17]|nr:hypothetical protein [bacterium]PJB64151.1 MAG: hypothetical protein CO094_13890 [Anaerolineae bacterium CG_4_9_14_3_um_filter_57_17]
MNKISKVKGALEVLLVSGLILVIPLFFAIKTTAEMQEAKNTPMPLTPTAMATFESNAVTTAKQPPACTFPLAQITAEESTPEEYIFSEPQIVLTEPDNIYDIVEWLPDNQQVLVTQDLNNARENGKPTRQSIELYNPETGESKIYATRYRIEDLPSWQPELNAVVYPAMNFLGFEANVNKLKFTRQVWVSYGNPDTAQMLADNLRQFPLAVKPDGSATLYLSDKKIFKKNGALKDIPSVAFDSNQWDYAKGRISNIPVTYKMAWQPGTSLIFLYGDGVSRLDGYTYILDADTGQVCELNMGGWAVTAHWSPDGRYLAIIRTHDHFPISSSDLTVLDTLTGKVYIVGVTLQIERGKHYVDAIAWAPDNRHLLAIGKFSPYANQPNDDQSRLYLVDLISGQSDDILPAYTFYAGSLSGNFAWSPDGSKVLVRCPTETDEKICFITVKRSGQ